MSQPSMDISPLESLANLLQTRNQIDLHIAQVIGRPALLGHIGEWVASQIFGIELHASATHRGSDGIFTEPPLRGRTVNVKLYGKREGILDLKRPDQTQPDFYLVLTGPKSPAASSRGSTRPCLISEVFLFEAAPLLNRLGDRQVRIGVATSLTAKEWDAARIYPEPGSCALYHLQPRQRGALELLSGHSLKGQQVNCIFGQSPIDPDDLAHHVIEESLELSKTDANLTEWTAAVKDVFARLAPKHGCQALYSSKEHNCSEFMLDLVWWNEEQGVAALAMESEWGSPREYRNSERFKSVIDQVSDDFFKLLVFKAPLKILVHTSISSETRHALHERLLSDMRGFRQHVAGECYLVFDFSVTGECSAFKLVVDRDGQFRNQQFVEIYSQCAIAAPH